MLPSGNLPTTSACRTPYGFGLALTGRIALSADAYLSFVLCLIYILKYRLPYSVGYLPYIFSGENLIFYHFYYLIYTVYVQRCIYEGKPYSDTVSGNTISVY